MCLQAWNCVCVWGGVKGYILFLELLTHIAKLASRKAGLRYAPGSGLPECLFPCMITSMGYYACGFIFWFSPRILCFPGQRREGPGVLSGPLELHSAPPSGKPPSHLAFSFSPSHRGWTSDPDVSGASVGVGRSQSRGEEEGAHQLEETVLAGERV